MYIIVLHEDQNKLAVPLAFATEAGAASYLAQGKGAVRPSLCRIRPLPCVQDPFVCEDGQISLLPVSCKETTLLQEVLERGRQKQASPYIFQKFNK